MSAPKLRALAVAVGVALVILSSPAPASADPVPLPAPGQPVASQVTTTSAQLTWAPSAGPVFRYSMRQLIDGMWQGYASMPSTTFQVAGLSPDTEYTFAVYSAALPGSGYTLSPLSEPVTFRTLPEEIAAAAGAVASA